MKVKWEEVSCRKDKSKEQKDMGRGKYRGKARKKTGTIPEQLTVIQISGMEKSPETAKGDKLRG